MSQSLKSLPVLWLKFDPSDDILFGKINRYYAKLSGPEGSKLTSFKSVLHLNHDQLQSSKDMGNSLRFAKHLIVVTGKPAFVTLPKTLSRMFKKIHLDPKNLPSLPGKKS